MEVSSTDTAAMKPFVIDNLSQSNLSISRPPKKVHRDTLRVNDSHLTNIVEQFVYGNYDMPIHL